MRKRVRVMGIDASLSGTGLAFESGTKKLINDLIGMSRIAYIIRTINGYLKSEGITHVALEGYAFGLARRQQGIRDTAELVGAIKLLCLSNGIPIILVPPSSLKKFVTGKGNAQKQEVMTAIKQRWGKAFTDSDRADAYALMRFGTDWLTDANGARKGTANKVRLLTQCSILQSVSLTFSIDNGS